MISPTNNGQVVSLSICNAGLLAEEDVVLTMRPSCSFDLVATSKSTVTLQGQKISLPKLAKREIVTVLILVRGNQFVPEDIESVESKATEGKVVETKEKAIAAWQHFIALPILLIFVAGPFLLGNFFGGELKLSIFGYVKNQYEILEPSKQLAGFKISTNEKYAHGKLEGALNDSRIAIAVKEVVRRGDILTFSINIKNSSGAPLKIDGSISGTAGKGSVDFYESRVEDFALADGENKLVKMRVFLPESNSVKMAEGTFNFKGLGMGSIAIEQVFNFD